MVVVAVVGTTAQHTVEREKRESRDQPGQAYSERNWTAGKGGGRLKLSTDPNIVESQGQEYYYVRTRLLFRRSCSLSSAVQLKLQLPPVSREKERREAKCLGGEREGEVATPAARFGFLLRSEEIGEAGERGRASRVDQAINLDEKLKQYTTAGTIHTLAVHNVISTTVEAPE